MSRSDSQRILDWIDSALEVFQIKKGGLTVSDTSIRGMLATIRNDTADHLAKSGGYRGPQPTSREFPPDE
jgi:hypothetical protein